MNELFGKIFVKSESRKIAQGTLRVGAEIKIRAKFRKAGDKLNVDLFCDKKSSTLSMSIGTGQQVTVKEVFEATIKVCEDFYEVLVNDKNVFNITHQKNTQNIQKIVTSGCKIYFIEVVQDNKQFKIPDIVISDLSEPKEKPADDDEIEENAEDEDVQSPEGDDTIDSFEIESLNSSQQSLRFNESLMKTGDVITLEAKVLNENEPCNINFLGSGDSVILQISINHQESEIICNDYTLENGWGEAEKFTGFPVSSTENFQIIVTVHESHFELQINGQHLCNFSHRQPFAEVKNIVPKGALFCSVQTVEADVETVEDSEEITDTQNDSDEVQESQEGDDDNNTEESPSSVVESVESAEAEEVEEEEEPVVVLPPLIKKIPKSDLKTGFFITIKGRIPATDNKSMIISLQESEMKKIFHITIDLEKNQIIRNDATPEKGLRKQEMWGVNPISCEKNFKLKIIFHPQQYELQIDNKHFCSFHQRMPISLIKELVITGGTVFSVNFGNTRDLSSYPGSRRGSQNSICSANFTTSKKSIEL